MDGAVLYLICHRHTPEGLDGSQLHRQRGGRLSHTLQQCRLNGRVSSLQCISHVSNNLHRKE